MCLGTKKYIEKLKPKREHQKNLEKKVNQKTFAEKKNWNQIAIDSWKSFIQLWEGFCHCLIYLDLMHVCPSMVNRLGVDNA